MKGLELMKWTEVRKTDLGYLVAFLVVTGFGFIANKSSVYLSRASYERIQNTERRLHLNHLLNLMTDAEASQRGYLLTGKEAYARPYEDASSNYPKDLVELKALFKSDEQQLVKLDELNSLIEEKLNELNETIQLRKRGQGTAALNLVNTDRGRELMAQIRSTIAIMIAREEAGWVARSESAARSIEEVNIFLRTFSFGVLFFVGIAWRYSRRRKLEQMSEIATRNSVIELQYQLVAGGHQIDELMNLVVERAERLTNAAGAVVEMADGDDMVYRAASGSAAASLGMRLKRSTSLTGRSVATGEVLICEDSEDDPRADREACRKIGLRSMVVVPLRHQQVVVGVLKVYSPEPSAFDEHHRTTLQLLSGYLGVMLDRATSAAALKKADEELRNMNSELERKVSERTRALQESENRFRIVAENIDAVLWMSTADRKQMLYVNPAYERYYGKTCQSLLDNPTSFADAIHPEDRQSLLDAATDNRSQNGLNIQFRFLRPDGEVRWARSVSFPIANEKGEVDRIVGFVTDITDLRNANLNEQAAREASKLKSEFLANMSHEIRTPINGVVGMANILLDTALSEEQKNYTQNIVRSADTLLTLVNDILDLSKAEANKIELELIDFDVEQLVDDVESILVIAAKKKRLEFLRFVAPGLPRFLRGDPTRLRQVLINLTSNAIKFTEKGHVKLSLSGKPAGDGRYQIRCDIEDTGVGIPQGVISRLFQAFSQADASTTRRYGGSGLGLSISKSLVELMGGQIGVTSTEGKGSNFYFTLTLESAHDERKIEAHQAMAVAPIKRLRVLVAEDNSMNQLIAIKMLNKMGHSAVAVANGQEAIEALKQTPYDLVLMDCQMPEMDGYEATKNIRGVQSSFRDIKIIAMTANAMAGDREKCMAAGMNDYVPKPVKASELQAAIERTMSQIKKAG